MKISLTVKTRGRVVEKTNIVINLNLNVQELTMIRIIHQKKVNVNITKVYRYNSPSLITPI
jgi:hypothetical protein